MKFSRAGFVTVVMVLSTFSLLIAQTYEGRILGTVTDASCAIVVGAKVTVANVGTNVARNLVSNSAGEYVASNLVEGTYKVWVEAPGFKKAENSSVVVQVSRDARVDFRLQPGAPDQTVEVTSEATLVDTSDARCDSGIQYPGKSHG
jgi:hypothetical protein